MFIRTNPNHLVPTAACSLGGKFVVNLHKKDFQAISFLTMNEAYIGYLTVTQFNFLIVSMENCLLHLSSFEILGKFRL